MIVPQIALRVIRTSLNPQHNQHSDFLKHTLLHCHHIRYHVTPHHMVNIFQLERVTVMLGCVSCCMLLSSVVNMKTRTSSAASPQLMCVCSAWLAFNEEMEPTPFQLGLNTESQPVALRLNHIRSSAYFSRCILTQHYWHNGKVGRITCLCSPVLRPEGIKHQH